ncbi:RdgB/HAM1 family non-canonical purine NTP pyrophosphatase [Stenotrophomonas acidaminiphila]|uniref:RdgB/HAM1 family non-canonical purine NTP pyrophosphatase n=1 Tax=Stenotrophomonas acidaminiphila TaxID=128780 RepID=UPI0028A5C072|nr:RdgB/HAM1 family non-canonical purine NTP pyrophosphatase [Stenotrophomonas acidaminiphila]
MKTLVLASHNAGKLAEMREILADLPLQVTSAAELGLGDVEETGLTFVENALLKARAACQATGLPALADDSGLIVDALGGAPGLYSARYAGVAGNAAANNAKLLEAMAGIPDGERGARFYAVIVLLRHATDPQPLICEGRWEGRITHAPRGTHGFGYNPVFLDERHGLTAAEMEPALKNAISHRALALQQLKRQLAAWH